MADFDVSELKMEGDVFELRESQERNKHYAIEVTQDGKTKEYVVKMSATAYGVGSSLTEALHQLANYLDAKNMYSAEATTVERMHKRRKLKFCQYCDTPIFFAKTHSGKWMPIDGEPIDCKEAQVEESHVRCFMIIDSGGVPHVRSLSNPGGKVWIAHPDVCGALEDAPKSLVLRMRWNANRQKLEDQREGAVGDLKKILHDLEG